MFAREKLLIVDHNDGKYLENGWRMRGKGVVVVLSSILMFFVEKLFGKKIRKAERNSPDLL